MSDIKDVVDNEDMFEYDGIDFVYKCVECSNDKWRICVDGRVQCTECVDTYDIGAFVEAPPND